MWAFLCRAFSFHNIFSVSALEEPPHPWLLILPVAVVFPGNPLQSKANSLQLCFVVSSVGFCCPPTGLPVSVLSFIIRMWIGSAEQCPGFQEGWHTGCHDLAPSCLHSVPFSQAYNKGYLRRVSWELNRITHVTSRWNGLLDLVGRSRESRISCSPFFSNRFFRLFLLCPWKIP